MLLKNTLTSRQALENLVEAETSEWSDIFIYVVNTLKEKLPIFQYVASRIQAHHARITDFICTIPESQPLLAKMCGTPKIWDKKLLVVDDEPILRYLVSSIFGGQFDVETATNGEEAANMVKQSFYDAVVSDIDMPIMSGITLFERLKDIRPEQRNHILYYSGNVTADVSSFFELYRIDVLEKPFQIDLLKKKVSSLARI